MNPVRRDQFPISLMNRIPRREFLCQTAAVGLPVLFMAACGKPSQSLVTTKATPYSPFADLERLVPTLMAETAVPGLAIALVVDGQLSWSRGFGVKDNASGDPVDIDTVFSAESLSKPVFAYLVEALRNGAAQPRYALN